MEATEKVEVEATPAPRAWAKIAAALAKAQGEFAPVEKNRTVKVETKTGGSYTFAYATLDAVLAATRPALAKHGIALTQLVDNGWLRTILIHESGESLETDLSLPNVESPQAFGSALTYMRRYAVVAILGVCAEEDDDGNAAEGNNVTGKADRPPVRSMSKTMPKDPPGVMRPEAAAEAAHEKRVRELADAMQPLFASTDAKERKKAAAIWIGWATGRMVDTIRELKDEEITVALAKAKAGEVPPEKGAAA